MIEGHHSYIKKNFSTQHLQEAGSGKHLRETVSQIDLMKKSAVV
jgi:hypothetical protein